MVSIGILILQHFLVGALPQRLVDVIWVAQLPILGWLVDRPPALVGHRDIVDEVPLHTAMLEVALDQGLKFRTKDVIANKETVKLCWCQNLASAFPLLLLTLCHKNRQLQGNSFGGGVSANKLAAGRQGACQGPRGAPPFTMAQQRGEGASSPSGGARWKQTNSRASQATSDVRPRTSSRERSFANKNLGRRICETRVSQDLCGGPVDGA